MDGTMYFADRIVFLDDISYIYRQTVTEKKPKKDSFGNQMTPTRYEIVFQLKSNNNKLTTWYSSEETRDKDYNELVKAFTKKKTLKEMLEE